MDPFGNYNYSNYDIRNLQDLPDLKNIWVQYPESHGYHLPKTPHTNLYYNHDLLHLQ